MCKKPEFVFICFLSIALILCGCNKQKPGEVQSVIDKINEIDTVDYDDELLIGECEEAYFNLEPEYQKEVSNIDKLYKAREKMDELLLKKPIPFSNALWTSSRNDVINIEGRMPDEEYDTEDNYHVLQYNNCYYEDQKGLIRYSFSNEKLEKVLFIISGFDDDVYRKYNDQFFIKYGKPEYENEVGKVWYQVGSNVGILGVKLLGGSIVITFAEPTFQ